MKFIPFIAFTVLFIFLSPNSYSQGCSDAGVCTMDFGDHSELNPKSSLSILATTGKADNNVTASAVSLEYQYRYEAKSMMSIKVSGAYQSGITSVLGLSDVFLSGSNQIFDDISLLYGIKLPLSDGNIKKNSLSLPMDYQTSLGTIDMYAGVQFTVNHLSITLAYQQPLTQNKNQFLTDLYPSGSEYRNYISTKNYKRSGDIVGRIDYNHPINEQFGLALGLIPIFHISDDKAQNNAGEYTIEGSGGLTLNGSVTGNYLITAQNQVSVVFAMPFITRDVRPDGLTRAFVASFKYSFLF